MPMKAIFPPGSGKTLAPYSPGAMADGVVYVSGTLALDKDTNVVHVGDAAKQTEYVLETIKSVIETAGGTMADVTFNQIFITDWANYAAVNAVYAKYFPGRQARALLHPVRPGEEGSAGRDRHDRPYRQVTRTIFDVHDGPGPDAETVLLSSGLGGAAGYWAPQLDALWPALSRRRLRPGRHRPHRRRAAGRPQHRRHGRRSGGRARRQQDDDGPLRRPRAGRPRGSRAGAAPARAPALAHRRQRLGGHPQPHPSLLRRPPGAAEARGAAGLRALAADLPLSRRLAGAERRPRGAGRGARARRLPGRRTICMRASAPCSPSMPGRSLGDISSCRPSSSRHATMSWCRAPCREELAAAIPGARLHVAPWGAHAINVTEPAAFNALLLDFLSCVPAKA